MRPELRSSHCGGRQSGLSLTRCRTTGRRPLSFADAHFPMSGPPPILVTTWCASVCGLFFFSILTGAAALARCFTA